MDSVDVNGAQCVSLVHWQRIGFAVELTGAGEDNPEIRIADATGLEDGQVCPAVGVKITIWIAHGIHMTAAAGQIEEIILPFDQGQEISVIP